MKSKMTEARLRARFLRSVVTGAAFALFVIAGFFAIRADRYGEDSAPTVLRAGLNFNAGVWRSLGVNRLSRPEPAPAPGTPPRVNGDIGLSEPVDLTDYTITVNDDEGHEMALTLDQIRAVDASRFSTLFKCVEGWSMPLDYAGPRFSDVMEQFNIGKKADGSYYKYVGLETPDQQYYVSIDMESMRHLQTVLALEMNGVPISPEHGAPVRLIIPIKYGIKNLKRIGFITFSDTRPPDYWAENGYDWFAGL